MSDSISESEGEISRAASPQPALGISLYKRLDRFYDVRYGEWRIVPTPTEIVLEKDKYKSFAFIVRRNLDEDKLYQDTILIIKSQQLGEVINTVLVDRDVEGVAVIGDSSEISPHILYHYLDNFRDFDLTRLMSIINPQQAEVCRSDLNALIQYLESEYSFEVAFADQLLSYDPPYITFDLLWLIFKPNTLVFTENYEESLGGRLLQLLLPTVLPKEVVLNCKSINFDGKYIGFENGKYTINHFTGTRPVTELPFFPFIFHRSWHSLRYQFAERGRKFVDLCELGKSYVHCEGIVEGIGGGGFGDKYRTGMKFDLKNRVMLDPETFWSLERPGDKPSVKIVEYLDDTHLQLCNTWLPGFIMEHKKWGFIPIVDIADIKWVNDMLANVVLDQTTKDLIQGFVTTHKGDPAITRLSEDVVPGKGVGLVMLFTGPPGVGKTVTAEAVAEIAHRPLYSISASELGSQPYELDRNLASIFRNGTLWNAVLLLDEADVFLEQRTSFDVKRNSLVSTFLRRLEYYTGIIILTSNRVETFDKALESRVHFNLRFKELDRISRMRLWDHFMKGEHQEFSDSDRGHLADLMFNGRMIQHAVSLSRSLAKARGEDFSFNHVRRVLDYIDPTRCNQKVSDLDELHYASPLDPAMSTTATPATPTTDPIGTPRNFVREIVHRGSVAQRSPSSGTGMDDSPMERGTKRPRYQ